MAEPTISLEDISKNMEVAGVPGLVLTIIEDHQLKATYPLGVKNFETKEPTTENTIFQAASLSKPVFAYGVLSLQQEGRLDLDPPLNDYLSLPESDEVAELKQITARQVLSHTTGLQNWRFHPEDRFEFAFNAGTGFSYSGERYFYLQRVLEQITGKSIESFLQERVLHPLGMANSAYIWQDRSESCISMGHRDRGKKSNPWNMWQGRKFLEIAVKKNQFLDKWMYHDFVEAMPLIPNNMIPNVAGSLLTTAPEYAQIMIRLLDPNNEVTKQMFTPQQRLNNALSWGLGIGLEEINDVLCFWHWGDNGFFGNFMFGNPTTGNGIVILSNDVRGLSVCKQILRDMQSQPLAAFVWLE